MFYWSLLNFLLPLLLLAGFAESSVVGVMATAEEELGDIVSFMEGPVKKYSYGMRTFYRGRLWGVETIIVLSNAGKAAAASATVDLMSEKVDYIVLIGTAGALDKRLKIGDVVIAKNLIEFDVDFRPFTALYNFPDKKMRFHTDPNLRKKTKNAVREFFETELFSKIDEKIRKETLIEAPKVITAGVGTADHFLISEDEIHNLATFAPDIVCIDMESAAVARVANNYGIPLTVIKTVSNYIDTPSDPNSHVTIDYNTFLQKVQTVYSKHILKRLFSKIPLVRRKPINQKIHKTDFIAGIICTTKKELESLFKLFENYSKIANRGGYDFYQGTLGKYEVVIAASGFGKSAASSMAEELIFNEQVKLLLNVGNAFSIDTNVNNGDIVISESLIEYDVDVRPFRPLFQLPTIGVTDLSADAKLVQIAYEVSSKNGVHIGQVASGDTILKQKDCLLLKTNLPNTLCIDSEAAPIAQIAYQSGIPFMSIKRISNTELLDNELDSNLLQILHNLFEQISKK